MPIDPDQLSEAKRKIYNQLIVHCSVEEAEKMINDLEHVQGAFRKANESVALFEKGLYSLESIQRKLSSAFGAVSSAANSFSGIINGPTLSMKAGIEVSSKYRESFVQTYSQFQKYGTTVSQYSARIDSLRNTYKLTYEQSIKLASGMEKSFNLTNPKNLDGYLQGIRKTVGNNVDAINEFRTALEGATKNNPIFQELLANSDFKGAEEYAQSLLGSGQMDMDTYKAFQEAAQAQNRPKSEQDQLDQLMNPVVAMKGMAMAMETGVKNAGDLGLAGVEMSVKIAGGLENVEAGITKVTEGFVLAQTAVSGLSSVFSGLVGSFSGVLGALDAAANLKLLGLGGGALKSVGGSIGKGVLSLGGIGLKGALGATGVGALAAATAYGGYKTGNFIAGIAGVNGYDTTDAENAEYQANSRGAVAKTDKDKLLTRMLSLGAKSDKEKMQSLSGFTGLFRSQGVASDETTKSLKDAQSQLADIIEKEKTQASVQGKVNEETKKTEVLQSKVNEEVKKIEKSEELVGIKLQKNDFFLKQQQRYLESSNKLLSSQISIYGKSGNITGIGSAVSLNNVEINKEEQLIKDRLEILKKQRDSSTNETGRREALSAIRDKEAELNALTEKRVENTNMLVSSNQPQIEQQERVIGLLETNISLQDSAGLGLKAQISSRKQLIDQIGVELSLLNQKEDIAIREKQSIEQRLQTAVGEEKNRLGRELYEQNKNILEIQKQQTQAVQKQAEVSKSMREGWIGAIQAMTSGAGVFTRIVLDKDKRLGNLAFARPDAIKALALGGTTGGRTESARWTPGGFSEGSVGGFEKSVLKQYGVDTTNTVQQTVKALMDYQKTTGSQMSTAAASFGIGPQGTGEVTELVKKISDIFITAFTAIGYKIKDGTLKELDKGR